MPKLSHFDNRSNQMFYKISDDRFKFYKITHFKYIFEISFLIIFTHTTSMFRYLY
jgi:hypothetical protein